MTQNDKPAPLFLPVLFWCVGIALSRALVIPFIWQTIIALALFVLALFFKSGRIYLLLGICLLLGGMRWTVAQQPSALEEVFKTKSHIQQDSRFLVTNLISSKSNLYQIRLYEIAGIKNREKLLLYSDYKLNPGQQYSALLEIVPAETDAVLDMYPSLPRAYIRQNLKAEKMSKALFPIAIWRTKLLANLETKMGDEADFAKALLFSDISAKGKYRDELIRSGMIHLIVVSGLHIWFIYAICMIVLKAFFPPRLAELIFLILIIFYAALNYWAPPVLRSILMIGLMIIARWRNIPLGSSQLLALSMLIITAINPNQLFDIGLQLSFLCVGVILLGLPHIEWIKEKDIQASNIRNKVNNFFDLLLMNLVVGLAVMPLTLYYFGTASLNGIIGNILGIPLSGVILILSFLILVIPAVNLLSASLINSYRFLLYIFNYWTELVASIPFYLQNYWITSLQLAGCILLIIGGLSMLRKLRISWQKLIICLIGIVLIIVPQFLHPADKGIYLFNCGTGDCILISLNDGQSIMIDTGPYYRVSEKSWASQKLIPWLNRKNIKEIDWLLLTHLDSDHSGGFPDIVNSLPIKNIAVSDETISDQRWKEWENYGLLDKINIHCIEDTISYRIGEASLKFLHPAKYFFPATSNSSSLVVRMDYQGKRYLFTGDADINAEFYMLEHYPEELKADYLKAGHHGSKSSSSREFIRTVLPEEVWISVGRRNQWNFPHPEPMYNFQLYAESIRRTSEGTIYHSFTQKD
ncbi:MAG: DNA internalization-related competence protein ComEC/Rec2 [Candidatus Cloacimonadaceae bacterium]|jgi:competence protein ComEC|nr:DNA internalization-related competence protein ComEC/Rec2 [Candidatus Cloacimonadota bacterium]MDY0111596.1 DNA internalization-related competence protein ComEC/Rec2 [Candidatus Syntrophosphaera sp.]